MIDSQTGTQTEINERGPSIGKRYIRELLRRVERLLSQTSFRFVVLSGSLPPDAPDTLYADLIGTAAKPGFAPFWILSGAALREGLRASPWMVKPNRSELETLLQVSIDTPQAAIKAAQTLYRRVYCRCCSCTQGAAGADLAFQGETWQSTPPSIDFASAVASGDSFLAAFLWAWLHSDQPANPEYALRLATGAGAANASVIGAGFCTREQIFTLAEKVSLCSLL